ncbi:arabinosyltransferase domain-containing protein [Williamsia sterculiae]|nr:arabinosyltransferase domain-containing protein [Williamsia sterculiae]
MRKSQEYRLTSEPVPTSARVLPVRTLRIVAVVAGLLGAVLAVLTPLLPVNQTTASFDWPQRDLAGDTSSVVAPLIEQTPAALDATIPCALIARLPADGGVLLSTMPSSAENAADRALIVSASASTVTVSFRNGVAATASRADIASSRCRSLILRSDNTGPSAQFVGLGPVGHLGPISRPQVSGIYSALSTADVRAADGLRVHVEIDSRFSTGPSAIKITAIVLAVLATLVALVALGLLDRAGGYHRRVGARSGTWWRRLLLPRPTDLAVTATLIVWHFLGAGTGDDGYILTMGRVGHQSGYLMDYYRYFGIPEAPFDWYYSFLSQWSEISTAGVWMRIPSLLAGLISWFILSRVLLPRLGAAVRRSAWALWAAAAVFTAFWLPFASGLRSESVIILGSLLTWWGVEQAISTRRLLPAALATTAAGFTLAAAPHGLVAVAVLIVGARPMLKLLITRRRETGLLSLLAPVLAAGLLVLVVAFRDQTAAAVAEAVRVRLVTGPVMLWNQEYLRYYFIAVTSPDGSLTRRVPVLLLFGALLVVLAVLLRRRRIGQLVPGPIWRALGAVLVTLVLWVFTPTKWTIQFGVFAGVAAAIAAAATVAVAESASRSTRNLTVFVSGLLFALAAAMAGYNAWPWGLNFGISWFDRAPVLAGIQVSTIFLALAVLTAALATWQHLRTDFVANPGLAHDEAHGGVERSGTRADRVRLTAASTPIALIAGLMVVCMVLVFAKAAVSRHDEFTQLSANLDALRGNSCAMADDVLVEEDPNTGMLRPTNGGSATEALAGDKSVGFTPNGVKSDLSPEYDSLRPGVQDVAGSSGNSFVVGGGSAGTLGGFGPTTVNGSTVKLPFGLDPETTPVLGSYGYSGGEADLTSGWYQLPDRSSSPLLVISAAGSIFAVDDHGVPQFGQSLQVEFGRAGSGGAFSPIGQPVTPIDPGPDAPNRPWRDMRVPMADVPADATAMRIVAKDTNLNPKQWLAVTPPRAPHLRTLQQVVGDSTPTLIDFAVAAQFPCQHAVSVRNGVSQVPQWRILPDRVTAVSQSKSWMDADAGGLLGISGSTTSADTVSTYLRNDWFRDWGSLQRLTPLTGDAPAATIRTGSETTWGWTRNGAIRAVRADD